MRRWILYVSGIAIALAVTFDGGSHAHAGVPDGDASDPISQASGLSVQGPATGLATLPRPPEMPQPSSNQPSPLPSQRQPTSSQQPPSPAPLPDPSAVAKPDPSIAPLVTAQCNDGWFSYSQTLQGTCDGHRGVMVWVVRPPTTAGAVIAAREAAAAILGVFRLWSSTKLRQY
jgi:Protein of unknown function (DUF3761)